MRFAHARILTWASMLFVGATSFGCIPAKSHPLAGRKRLPLARLARERFILREPGSGTRLACDAHFARAGFVPDVRLEIGSNEAIKEAVASGMGIAVVSRHALDGKSAGPGLGILGVAGFPLHSNWWISTRAARVCRPSRRSSSMKSTVRGRLRLIKPVQVLSDLSKDAAIAQVAKEVDEQTIRMVDESK